jgi:hypothetical protein
MKNEAKFSELVGKTLVEVTGRVGDDEMRFRTRDGEVFKLSHKRECCEGVAIEDICGDLGDLLDTPVLQAEESSNEENPIGVTPPGDQDCFTWTFYRIATIKGQVVIRWYGESPGHYSTTVDCQKWGAS